MAKLQFAEKTKRITKQIQFQPTIRDYQVRLDENGSIIHRLWIGIDWSEFENINLVSQNQIKFELGDYICPQCREHSKKKFDRYICKACLENDIQLKTRLDCLFNKPTSKYQINGSCERDNLACKISENKQFCHSPYILYLGRYGNIIKIGISRKNRRGGYVARLLEQGLNEAVVISHFKSLPDVLRMETELTNLGYCDRIFFLDKKHELTSYNKRTLLEDYPLDLMRTWFPDKQVEYFSLYPELDYALEGSKGPAKLIFGTIEYIRGDLLVCSHDSEMYFWNIKELINRKIISGI